ncbi:MerR family transcriptional regulator [Glycomyces amatae]|uniref:MerR family transcriptional regulator n=1 Tax=Glycomyces amatae TaxID=2881355 RepID=UPI002106E299|nr:MerR family transcriptional regulator [Glycomyces amatae]
MRIGELSRRTGVSVRSLRYYEQQDLLESERTPGGHREYAEAAVDRVVRIQILFAAGLNSATIHDVLPCMSDADGGPNERTTESLARELRVERDRIDRQIQDLVRTRGILDEVIDTAEVREPA